MTSGPTVQQPGAAPTPEGPDTAAAQLARWHRAGGVVAPVMTALLAFLVGGLVVLATGSNPVEVYKGIWNGTGFEWFYRVGSHEVGLPFSDARVWFPWDPASRAAENRFTLILPPPDLCTDNAAMVAWTGAARLARGLVDDLAAPSRARWPLDPDAAPALGAGVKA